MKELHPPIEPFAPQRLSVDNGHWLHIEVDFFSDDGFAEVLM